MKKAGANHESSLLLTLEEISQLVSHSHNRAETLGNIVQLIQGRFHTDVCSAYLLEPEGASLVLAATVGLKPEGIGRVRMRLEEGLTGLVAELMAPVMVGDAVQHPRFKYFPEAGEDPYHSFLGVPLIESGALQGVLVVQTLEARVFSSSEIRMLVTVASQLAPLVGDAQFLEQIIGLAREESSSSPSAANSRIAFTGLGAALSPGIGQGRAYINNGFAEWEREIEARSSDSASERHRLAVATEAAREEISRLGQHLAALVGEDHGAILQAQLLIMQDRTMEQDLAACLATGSTAEGALMKTLNKYIAVFQKLARPFFQERLFDVKDVFRRILWHLRLQADSPGSPGARLVLVAAEASVLDLFSVDPDRLAAVVVEHGGIQSHAAILARSLGIPMVGQLAGLTGNVQPGNTLLVDGTTGRVYLDPLPQLTATLAPSSSPGFLPTDEATEKEVSAVGPRVEVNINLLGEVTRAVGQRAQGVGLYRSEFLFLARRTFPTEEEQVGVYRKLLTLLQGRPAAIRTFDLRPDKLGHCVGLTTSSTYPLDWRRVLESPPVQKLFKDQVRAILRAAVVGPARILVPLVTRTEQLDFVIQTVDRARMELYQEGLEVGVQVPLGIMIEVAAAAVLVETWSGQVDFFALGTNDLTASALGLDRDDSVGAGRNDSLHPGLLRLMRSVVTAAHLAGKPVSVCGEMAADPQGVLALAAMGVDSLSVPVNQLRTVRRILLEETPVSLAALEPHLAGLQTADKVRDFLCRWPIVRGRQ